MNNFYKIIEHYYYSNVCLTYRKEYKMKVLDYTILTFVVVGAINWGLIGFFDFDLVSTLFGQMSMFTRIIYALVGIGGLYAISYYGRMNSELQ